MTITKEFIAQINNRPLVVWGARMTGIGFYHFAQTNRLNIISFIDSDPSLNNKKIGNIPIYLPAELSTLKTQHQDLLVVVAVSIKEDEILASLERFGIPASDYIQYKNYCKCFFTIDVAGTCNLRCPSCANSTPHEGRPKGFMSVDNFRRIIEKMVRDVGLVSHICLYNWGEPLLHPKLNQFIDYAHEKGIAVAVSTNLSISSPRQLVKLVKSAPDILKISLSGYFPETYNQTHTGGNIDLVKSNLYRLKYYIERCNSSFPVEVNYHLYRHNSAKDLSEMQRLCDELGFIFSSCYANVTPVERVIDYCNNNTDPATKEFLKLLAVSIDKGLEITKPSHHIPCRFMSNQININWDRTVSLCCISFERSKSLVSADYLEDSIYDIQEKKKKHELCQTCQRLGIHQYFACSHIEEWEKAAKQDSQ